MIYQVKNKFGILGTRKDNKRNWKAKRWFDSGHVCASTIRNKIDLINLIHIQNFV